jgi:sugar phosphate isomerase/epimerase
LSTDARNDHLLACFYTLTGAPNGQPARHSFETRVRAAAEAGYIGIGMSGFDVEACVAGGLTLEEMAKIGADHGAPVLEMESLAFFATNDADDDAAAHELFTMGERLGAHHVNVSIGRSPGARLDLDSAAAAFAHLCDVAAEHGLMVAFEFMPPRVISSVEKAHAIVATADRPNGGLDVDTYHFFRGGSSFEELACVPGERILAVQLSDVPLAMPGSMDELLVETRTRRLLPGAGELPLVDFIHSLDRTGSTAPIGIEILSTELQALSADEAAGSTYDAGRAILSAARDSRHTTKE